MFSESQHPVIELIKKRKSEGSRPLQRSDKFKLGLVIEGGGMRGIVAAGMATGLHKLGLVDVFDAVYGSSAGALAGSLFVTNAMPMGPTIYYEDLTNKNFINLCNVFSSDKPIMNLNYLIENILQKEKPLDWRGVINSKIPLNIIVSSLTQRKSICVDKFKSKDELFQLLRATATVPIIAGSPINYKDDILWDAALYEPIAYRSAILQGCTHVLVLLTRPKGIVKSSPNIIEKLIISPRMNKTANGTGDDYLIRNNSYNKDLELLYKFNTMKNSDYSIYSIYLPEGNKVLPGLIKDKNKLIEAAQCGENAVLKLFL